MRTPLPLAIVVLAAGAATAEAQAPPKACRIFIEVENAKVAATTQAKATCEFGGKVSFIVSNLDDADYKLIVEKFRFDSASPGVCNSSAPEGPSPINGSSSNQFKFNLNPEQTHTKKTQIKAMGANTKECFKFDIALTKDNGSPLDRKDPELEVTEPSGPPPIKKPGND